MSAPAPSRKDGQQVLQYAFDDATGKLRVDAVISPSGHDLQIDYTDDSIAIGDPASNNLLAINSDGSVNVNSNNVLVNKPFDYLAAAYPSPTTEVYTYRLGGAGGTLQATVTVTYTDASKANLLSVVKT
jgi:hypothetical protein